MTKPFALLYRVSRGLARSILRADDAACGIQAQAASVGPAWGGAALGLTHAKES